jgi:hypothetical protein
MNAVIFPMSSKKNHTVSSIECHAQKFLVLGIGVHILFLLSLHSGFLNPVFDDATHCVGQGADFYAVYQAGQNIVDGVSIYLRDPKTLVVPFVWTGIVYGTSLFLTVRTSASYSMELFILWILSYFLTFKHIWEHHYVLLLQVFVLLYWLLEQRRNYTPIPMKVFWWTFGIIAAPTLFVLIDKGPRMTDPEFYWTTFESLVFHCAKPLAVLILYCALCISLLKYGKQSPTSKKVDQRSPIIEESV